MRALPVPHLSLNGSAHRAEQMVEALREQHERIAQRGPALAWYAHLPGGDVLRIWLISSEGPFVRLTGYGASETEYDYVLVPPESLVVQIKTEPPGDMHEARRPFGFGKWPEAGV